VFFVINLYIQVSRTVEPMMMISKFRSNPINPSSEWQF